MKPRHDVSSQKAQTQMESARKPVIGPRGKWNDIHRTAKLHRSVTLRSFIYIGKNVEIGEGTKIANYCKIGSGTRIGKNCNLQDYVCISDNTIIGDDTFFGAHSCIADEKYPTVGRQIRRTVVIGRNVMIGTKATIIAVNVGDNAVIGAHAKVVRYVPAGELWADKNVASKVGYREDYDAKKEEWEAENL